MDAKRSAMQIYADDGSIALYYTRCRLRPARSRVFAYCFVDASRHDRLAQGSASGLGRESSAPVSSRHPKPLQAFASDDVALKTDVLQQIIRLA